MSALAALSFVLFAFPSHAALVPLKEHPRVEIDDRGRPEERAAFEQAFARLRTSATVRAREGLRRSSGLSFIVSFDPLSGPEDKEVKGRCFRAEDPIRIVVKEDLLAAGSGIPQVLAHELYGHGISRASMHSVIAADVWRLEADEIYATLIGAVIARELGEPEIEDEALDAYLRGGAEGYHAAVLFQDSPSALKWTLDEARDPAAAVAARLAELARRRRTLADRESGDRAWLWAFEHFETTHGMPRASFAFAHSTIDAWRKDMTQPRRALLDRAEPHLKGHLPYLRTPDGLSYLKRMIALARDPRIATMARESEALAKRLPYLRAAARAPEESGAAAEAPPAGALSWEKIQELYNRDHAEHPEHWKNEPRSTVPEEWAVP